MNNGNSAARCYRVFWAAVLFLFTLCLWRPQSAIAAVESTNADSWHIQLKDNNDPTLLFVNGSLISAKVIIENGRALVPLRVFAETLGAKVEWIHETMSVNVIDTSAIDLRIGDLVAIVDDTPFMLPVAPRLVNSTTYVPLRFIAEVLGASVSYYGDGVGEGYIEGVKHIMVSRYPIGTKTLSRAEALAAFRGRVTTANGNVAADRLGDIVDVARVAITGETDRYYKSKIAFDILIDKYTGDCYTVYYNLNAIITAPFDPRDKDILNPIDPRMRHADFIGRGQF